MNRLFDIIAAACPINGVSVGVPGDLNTVRIDFANDATLVQRAAGQAALIAFDWSPQADVAWGSRQAVFGGVGRIQGVGTSTDPIDHGVMLLIEAVCRLCNDQFEALGRGRPVSRAAIMADIATQVSG